MRGFVHIEPKYSELFSFVDPDRPFESLSEYFGLPLGKDQRRRSKVVRQELDDGQGGVVVVYFKLYGYRRLRRALSRVFKPTRSQSEIANLKFFQSQGIPCCEPMLQGIYKNTFGIARNCMLITRDVTDAEQLDTFISKLEESEGDAELRSEIRRQIIESIAGNLRKIHEQKFYHDDLKWRNILVRRKPGNRKLVEVSWIDCPNGYFDKTGGFRGKHGRVKDLATMDHEAQNHCPLAERLHFLSVYSGLAVGSEAFDRLAEEVVRYRKLHVDD